VSTLAPLVVGRYAEGYALGTAFFLTAIAFLIAAILAFTLPETKGKALE